MDAAELVESQKPAAEVFDRIGERRRFSIAKEHAESLFRQRHEDVVLAREVAVDRGRAVLDLLGDLPDRDVPVALGDEKVPRRIQNRAGDSFALAFLSFFDSHPANLYGNWPYS
jgi:hypothetical protein